MEEDSNSLSQLVSVGPIQSVLKATLCEWFKYCRYQLPWNRSGEGQSDVLQKRLSKAAGGMHVKN